MILPEPVPANPIDGWLFVQLYTVPTTAPLKVTAAVVAPLHYVWLATAFTVVIGLIVTENDCPELLVQPLALVTVIVPV